LLLLLGEGRRLLGVGSADRRRVLELRSARAGNASTLLLLLLLLRSWVESWELSSSTLGLVLLLTLVLILSRKLGLLLSLLVLVLTLSRKLRELGLLGVVHWSG
jgi:hypothetical protein